VLWLPCPCTIQLPSDCHSLTQNSCVMTAMPLHNTVVLWLPCPRTTQLCYDCHALAQHSCVMTAMPLHNTVVLWLPCPRTTQLCHVCHALAQSPPPSLCSKQLQSEFFTVGKIYAVSSALWRQMPQDTWLLRVWHFFRPSVVKMICVQPKLRCSPIRLILSADFLYWTSKFATFDTCNCSS
jgi:hypothetical protein